MLWLKRVLVSLFENLIILVIISPNFGGIYIIFPKIFEIEFRFGFDLKVVSIDLLPII